MAISKAEPGKTRIGWIGTGVMGRWMCQHIMSKGYSATVYNRSKEKAQPLADAGAAVADSPKAVSDCRLLRGISRRASTGRGHEIARRQLDAAVGVAAAASRDGGEQRDGDSLARPHCFPPFTTSGSA